MKIIAVMSPKGGIGKTTTSDAIAYMLGEEQEKRVLILAGDPQGAAPWAQNTESAGLSTSRSGS